MDEPSFEPGGAKSGGSTSPFDVRSPDTAMEVVYDWNLESDELRWGQGYDAIPGLPPVKAVSTGLGFAEHLAAESPSSRYEAVMAPGGCDTGGGVPFFTLYGLVAGKRAQNADAKDGRLQPAVVGEGAATPVWVEDRGRWFADRHDRPARVHGMIRIVTERYEAERRRTAAAQRDPVTGAANRATFVEHVGRHLSLSARRAPGCASATFAVVLIGIERDGGGAPVGDGDLAEACARLRQVMRAHEMLARHAGFKLVALLDGCNEAQCAAAAVRFAAAVRGVPPEEAATLEFPEPGSPGPGSPGPGSPEPGSPTGLRAGIGAVIAPFHGRTPQALLQFAEEALEAAGRPGAAGLAFYRPELARARTAAAGESADEILAALAEGRLALALQPVVAAATRQAAFYEGLVRVTRLDGPPLMPDALIPRAEAKGLVPLVDRRVVELAFALLTADRKLKLSINAAVPSITDVQWLAGLGTACRMRPDAARRLTIEITETCAIADIEATRRTLAAIKPLGVTIAIDDFGSGHSSFRSLRQLPIDYLKIDGAFSQNLASSSDDRFFIRTLIDLARNLRIPTVAEWVEDEETARILTEWGIDFMQGHHFGRAELAAMPAVARSAAVGSPGRAGGGAGSRVGAVPGRR